MKTALEVDAVAREIFTAPEYVAWCRMNRGTDATPATTATTTTMRVFPAERRLIATIRALTTTGRLCSEKLEPTHLLANLLNSDLASANGRTLQELGIFNPK